MIAHRSGLMPRFSS